MDHLGARASQPFSARSELRGWEKKLTGGPLCGTREGPSTFLLMKKMSRGTLGRGTSPGAMVGSILKFRVF